MIAHDDLVTPHKSCPSGCLHIHCHFHVLMMPAHLLHQKISHTLATFSYSFIRNKPGLGYVQSRPEVSIDLKPKSPRERWCVISFIPSEHKPLQQTMLQFMSRSVRWKNPKKERRRERKKKGKTFATPPDREGSVMILSAKDSAPTTFKGWRHM